MAVNAVDSVPSLSFSSGWGQTLPGDHSLHRLSIGGTLAGEWTVAAGRVSCTLSDIVPVACQVADAIVARASARAKACGGSVPCRKGCSACCHFLTPVSIPEARWLWKRLQSLPSPRRERVVGRFLAAAEKILHSNLPTGQVGQSIAATGGGSLGSLSRWYRSLGLPCPMLEGSTCSLYDWRPLACREFAVTSESSQCGLGSGMRLKLPVSVAESLSELSQQYCGGSAMLLPLVPAWASSHANLPQATAPAGEWVERLFDVMRRRAHNS